MTVPAATEPARTVAIVGLGAVGRAIGLGLTRVRTNYRVLGHDRDAERVKTALGAGAIDQGRWNLREAVAGADLVVLAEPLDRLLATLPVVAAAVPPGALITDTASAKVPVLAAARQHVPAGVSFVGGHPVLRRVPGLSELSLAGATYCLVPLSGASEAAVRAITGLVEAVGARPLHIDAAEHDALVAAVVDVPDLLVAALVGAVADSPSARDLRRLAGPAFLDFTYLPDEDAAGRAAACLANAAAAVRWLDGVQANLATVRAALVAGDGAAIEAMLATAIMDRAVWGQAEVVDERAAEVADELKDYSPIRQLFLGRLGRSR